MSVIGWKDVYETGIVALDNEHRGLLMETNRLFEAIRDKRSDDVLDDILANLERYTVEHFQHEEQLMARYNYPDLDAHRRIHQQLIADVQGLKSRAGQDRGELAKELLKFMRAWILEHIVQVDKQYGAYLESRGGRFID